MTLSLHATEHAQWHVSLPNLSAGAFLDRLKERNWPPTEAFIAYTEWRVFAAPCLAREGCEGGGPERVAIHGRLAAALETLEHPEDLAAYRREFSAIAQGTAAPSWNPELTPIPKMGQWLRQGAASVLSHHHVFDEHLNERLTPGKTPPTSWAHVREVGMDWADVHESVQRDALKRNQNLAVEPAFGSPIEATLPMLMAALDEAGVPWLSWPAATGASAEEVERLAHEVHQVNAELAKTTGWSGPLLGLGGRVALDIGQDRSGNSGVCCVAKQCLIQTAPDIVWTAVAHEWLHALDSQMSSVKEPEIWKNTKTPRKWFASEAGQQVNTVAGVESGHSEAALAWKTLLTQLKDPQLTFKQRERLAREAVQGLGDRWHFPKTPGLQEAVVREADAARQPGWDRSEAFARLRPLIAHSKRDNTPPPTADNIDFSTEYAVTDIEMVNDLRRRSVAQGSLWVQYRARLDKNNQQHENLKSWGGYFQEPCEQAAFSFEALLPPQAGRLASDVRQRFNQDNLTYPLPAEAVQQKLSWRRFFRSAALWWEKRCQAFQPPPPKADVQPEALQWAARIQAHRMQRAARTPGPGPKSPRI